MPTFAEALKDLLFPPHCLGCGLRLTISRAPLLCPQCITGLRFLQSPLCSCCGLPFATGADHLCGDCLAGRHAFDLARSLLQYRSPASDLILALKFTGTLNGLATLRALFAHKGFLASFSQPDLLLPVPLHNGRLRTRGFNQALAIAKECLPQWRDRLAPDLLRRHRLATPQALLSGKKRRANLHNAFSLAHPDRVAGAKILLVDDVYTTGTTVDECSRVLRKAGAERIEVVTVARSLAPGVFP
ncbi:MAG: ComF family protein [Desulfobulbus sp.]|uniref:ComF family protein n=1 Tax=Desulfobulbus sp. TaxID=895 RepID=UPI0028494B00|nr:ComF family protein [Desulfobulbus sp.]MDR2551177.1 ComF family protein [Desulfobulbus sp.]